MTARELKTLIERVETWPEAAQEKLAQIAREIEAEIGETYAATPGSLKASTAD